MRQFTPYEQTQLSRYHISLQQAQKAGEMPVEYITGHVKFNGLDLYVTSDVLIPRVETEELAKRAVRLAQTQLTKLSQKPTTKPQNWRVLDLGTGGGAIAIYLAHTLAQEKYPSVQIEVMASDISPAALAVAAANAERLVPSPLKIQFVLSDLWQNIPSQLKFDLVIANLPYIPSGRIPVLDESVKDFEPWLALDGGSDGLKLIKPMLDQAPAFLKSDGQVLLEVDYTHMIESFQPWFDRFIITADLDEFLRQRYITCRLRPIPR